MYDWSVLGGFWTYSSFVSGWEHLPLNSGDDLNRNQLKHVIPCAQIVELMALYMKVIGDRDRQIIAPNQLIAMSSVYNRDVEQFYKTHMADPVVIIASQIEAAYAANVKQVS